MSKKTRKSNTPGRSIGHLTAEEAARDIGPLEEGEIPDADGILVKRDHNEGRGIYRRELAKFVALDDTGKLDLLRATWKEVAMGAAARAKAFVATCSSKDFQSLSRIISSGVDALQAAYPPSKQPLGPAFIVNMFGSLGQRAAAIATPAIPITIDAIPEETTWPTSTSMKTISSPPVTVEISPTKTPSTPSLNTP